MPWLRQNNCHDRCGTIAMTHEYYCHDPCTTIAMTHVQQLPWPMHNSCHDPCTTIAMTHAQQLPWPMHNSWYDPCTPIAMTHAQQLPWPMNKRDKRIADKMMAYSNWRKNGRNCSNMWGLLSESNNKAAYGISPQLSRCIIKLTYHPCIGPYVARMRLEIWLPNLLRVEN